MKRTIATLLAISSAAVAHHHCPCFTTEQLDDIMDSYDIGCHFTTQSDSEVQYMAVAYLYDGEKSIGTLQAGVTTELIEDALVDGGFCGIGSRADLEVKNAYMRDYADGSFAPGEFHACFNLMKAKCMSKCAQLESLSESRSGCGTLPF